jgi:hypothetical protein
MSRLILVITHIFFTISAILSQETSDIPPTLTPIVLVEECEYIELLSVLNCNNVNNLSNITASQAANSSIASFFMKPNDLISFDDTFSFSSSMLDKFKENFEVTLENFNSFAYSSNPFESINAKPSTLVLSESNLDFFSPTHNLTALNELCVFFPSKIKPLFSSFQRILFDKTVNFAGEICPLIFKDANLERLVVSSIPEKNNFQFSSLSLIENLDGDLSLLLNSTIKSFEVFQSSLKILGKKLVDPFVFSKTNRIVYYSFESNLEIEDDLFASFIHLNEFKLVVQDIGKFYKFKNLNWLHSLNANVSIDLGNSTQLLSQDKNFRLILSDQSNLYDYPGEDFCLFVEFPHSKRVFPIFERSSSLDCSCTIVYLTQYYPFYDELPTLTGTTKCDYNNKDNFSQLIANCNFDEKIRACKFSSNSTITSTMVSSVTSTTTSAVTSTTVSTVTSTKVSTVTSTTVSTVTSMSPLSEKCVYFPDAFILNCDGITNLTNVIANQPVQVLFIRPKNFLRLDKSLSFSGAEDSFRENFQIILENMGGFNLNANPFEKVRTSGGNIEIYSSYFEFFSSNHDDTSLADICIYVKTSYKPLVSSFKNLILGSNVNFSRPVCPLVFKDSRINRFVVSDSNSFKFAKLGKLENETANVTLLLNSSIQSFEAFKSSLKRLTHDVLNEEVFVRLQKFKYYSLEINLEIDDDLFIPFKYLKEFELNVPDLSVFLKNSSQSWISSINADTQIDLTSVSQLTDQSNKNKQFKLKLWDESQNYMFQDEDLCYFSDFPHSKLIFPILEDNRDIDCSCTVVWLTQYYPYFYDFNNLIEKSSFKCNYTQNFDLLIKSCNFEQEISKCKKLTTTTTATTKITNPTTTTIKDITTTTIAVEINEGNDTGVIVGSVVGGLAGLTIIFIGGYFIFSKIKKGKGQITPNDENEMKKV